MIEPHMLNARSSAENEIATLRTIEEFKARYDRMKIRFEERKAIERGFLATDREPFHVTGYCRVCDAHSSFSVDYASAYQFDEIGTLLPNWRETLVCPSCGLNNRVRCATDLLLNRLMPATNSRIYATEQVTSFYRWLKSYFPEAIGSEYLGSDVLPGQTVNGFRHEDLTRLSFSDNCLDLILSFDVLEHVPDYRRALAECLRCLKSGGVLLVSAPFAANSAATIVRARLTASGELEHLLSPEYHGNPTRPEEGSLCFYHFGWDILDDLRELGATDACVLLCYSAPYGYLGNEQLFILATR